MLYGKHGTFVLLSHHAPSRPPQVDGHLPEAFAVLGFAFYMQPMLMPLLKEMPAGPAGAKLTERAVHITLFGKRVVDCY